ncbi:MAG: hypothetical protein IAE90_07770 [Ignavibacteria bacterium]|nr:hypothetical protein [Ignavibacteria bacterium]
MKILQRVFIKGAVIIFIAAPFLFTGKTSSQILPELTLKTKKAGSEQHYTIKLQTKYSRSGELQRINVADTLIADTIKADSIFTVEKKKVTEKKFRMKKSPTVAVLLSAALPGAGQFYNESYWKIPIIGGLVGYFGYEYFRNNNLYKDYRERYVESQTGVNPAGDPNLKILREFYRDQRDDFVWYFLIVYVVNMVDAYVDAHLFDFDVKEDKLMNMNTGGKHYKLKMNLRF